ncbi:MAG TPA: phosphoribosyltransferase family protein, partial [Candidatus Saccharimonadia bacterium]
IATKDKVDRRLKEMAREIIARYKQKDPLFVCLLRGGAPFTTKLLFEVAAQAPDFHPELDYLTVKTYSNQLTSKTPEVVMDLAPDTITEGRCIIILDDILDEGHTATFVTKHLLKHGAAAVDLVVLVQKQKDRSTYPAASLYGFEASDGWIIGMGMDDPRVKKEAHRWDDYIGITTTN